MRNNNQAIVRKLVERSLTANKKRNFFLITAILLTTLMIASVLSVGLSYVRTMTAHNIRYFGTASHALIRNASTQSIERLKSAGFITSVALAYEIATVENTTDIGDIPYALVYCDEKLWNEHLCPAFTDIMGAYPQKENEIMLPLGLLQKMGFDKPDIGMIIPLAFHTADGKHSEQFVLSGYFTAYRNDFAGGAAILPVSEAFFKNMNANASPIASVTFKDKTHQSQNSIGLTTIFRDDQNVSVIFTTFGDENPFNMAVNYGMVILLLMFTGFLLIYNVLYISVSGEVRFYGLLKTVGTTPKQLRRVIIRQVATLCAIAIPAGAGLAALLSLILVPYALEKYAATVDVSFSPYIYIGAAAFSLATALIGAIAPARKAARISPVEAVRYSGETLRKKRVYGSGGAKPHRMAIRNIFRNKKRAAVVFLSLFLGLTLFMSIAVLTFSMDADKWSSYFVDNYDFRLNYSPQQFIGRTNESVPQKFDIDYLNKVNALPGFTGMDMTTQASGNMKYTDAFDSYINAWNAENGDPGFSAEMLKGYFSEMFTTFVYGIDISEFKTLCPDLDAEAFERGEFGLLVPFTDPDSLVSINEIEVTFDTGGETMTIPIAAVAPRGYKGTSRGSAPNVIVSNADLKRYIDDPVIYTIGIQADGKNDQQALSAIQELITGDDEVTLRSQLEERKMVREVQTLLLVLGGSLAGILGIIGVLNFINVMSVGIISRKRELATLESVGMTSRQTRRMLVCEGIGYALVSLLLAASLGSAIAVSVFRLFEKQQSDLFTLEYPYFPFGIVAIAILLICVIAPNMTYSVINKTNIVERLKEAE